MMVYIIKFVLCSALLFTFYHLFLERVKIFQFNRFFLLGILVFSLVVPAHNIYVENELASSITTITESYVGIIRLDPYLDYMLLGYMVVTILLIGRLGKNLFGVYRKIRGHQKLHINGATMVLLEEKILPHTFLNYIFINRQDYKSLDMTDALLVHEMTHVREKHTLDILIVELYQAIFWFNPMLIWVKQSIRLNHEFIADDHVVEHRSNIWEYQELLLKLGAWSKGSRLTSNINFPMTKMRFSMMVKKSPLRTRIIAKLAVLPLILTAVLLFANIVEGGEHNGEEHDGDNTEHVDGEHRKSLTRPY